MTRKYAGETRLAREIAEVLERNRHLHDDSSPVPAFGDEAVVDSYPTLRSLLEGLLQPRGYGIEDVSGMSLVLRGTRILDCMDDDTGRVRQDALAEMLDTEASTVDPGSYDWGVGGVDFSAQVWMGNCILTVGPAHDRDGRTRTIASFVPTVPPHDVHFDDTVKPRP